MKVTFEVDKSQTMTIPEVIEKVGVQKYCQKQMEGEPLIFSFTDDEKGRGVFYLGSGEVEYESGEADCIYPEGGLAEILDCCMDLWVNTENGEMVVYCA